MDENIKYTELLTHTFSEYREGMGSAHDINSVLRSIAMSGEEAKGFFTDSDVMVNYDLISDEPLLLIERVKLEGTITKRQVKSVVTGWAVEGYQLSVATNTKGYIDIMIVKDSIIKGLGG